MSDIVISFSIQCYKDDERRLTHELTQVEALCFRKAAKHLVEYLTKEYQLLDGNDNR